VISVRLQHPQTNGIIHVGAVLHAGKVVVRQQPTWLRRASTAGASVLDLGPLPTADVMSVTVATSSRSSGSRAAVRVYAGLSSNGQPDGRSLLYSSADTWSQGAA
jgi:hypothetical protein